MYTNITGTSGNDFLFLQGEITQFTATLVNPYSGFSVFIDEEKNVNTGRYDGLNGFDVLFLTNIGDVLQIADSSNILLIQNIERILAGDGGDVVNLASTDLVLSDIVINGGAEGDILWGNAGNDTIDGLSGDDHIDGGPGNDTLNGGEDNDLIVGGLGDDVLNGGAGNDILYGGNNDTPLVTDKDFTDPVVFPNLIDGKNIKNLRPPGDPALGVVDGNLSVDFDAQAEITFRKGFAGYNNTLGSYAVTADGTLVDAKIHWANVKTAGLDITHIIDLPTGADGGDFGFFIIANGDRVNQQYGDLDIDGNGVLKFIYDYGGANERDANITDDGQDISLVYDDGTTEKVLNGKIYHTTERDGDTSLNWDGKTHVLSGIVEEDNSDVLRIGFEDLPMLGDADYEDILFDLNIIGHSIDTSEPGNDILIGGAGDDILYGEGGNDILIVGEGADRIYGGTGSDTIAYDMMDGIIDTIFGFERGVGGDVLNITDILQGYDPLSDAISDFVRLTDTANGTEVQINADGDVGGAFTAIALIDGGIGTDTLANLIANGNLVADQGVMV